VLISGVGPYAKYGTPVVEACVKNSTHYFDVTGESPWVSDIIEKFDGLAKRNKAIIIPQIGVDSAPADLLSWSLVSHIRRTLSAATADIYYTIYEMRGKPSGGTLSTIFELFDIYPLSKIAAATKPWAQSPIGPPASSKNDRSPGLLQQVLGVRTVKDLGVMTTSLQGPVDSAEVYRSWGLIDQGKFYGDKFRFHPFMSARNLFTGAIIHLCITLGTLVMLVPPFRSLLRRLVYLPGDGPSRE